jgi:molybdopterin-binding protein
VIAAITEVGADELAPKAGEPDHAVIKASDAMVAVD